MSLFLCPKCGAPLEQTDSVYVCPEHHSYDRAKEGYVHLLPVHKMHAKVPGDSKEMVASRRTFLESGGYELFREKLVALVLEAVEEQQSPTILDAGCGEGYYFRGVEEGLRSAEKTPCLMGFDISKFAVKAAAKRQKTAEFAVASIFHIPVADNSVDCLINVFAPMVEAEFCRVLKSGGTMIFAVPTERHLYGLKEVLYDEPYENAYKETDYEGFDFVKREAVTGTLTLTDPEQIQNLFRMTPYYWKTPVEGSRKLAEATVLQTEIGFDFLVYRKK